MNALSALRTTEGHWSLAPALLHVLTIRAATTTGAKQTDHETTSSRNPTTATAQLPETWQAAQPTGVSSEQWATVLVLAYLVAHCSSEKPMWDGMQQKAIRWLHSGWKSSTSLPVAMVAAKKAITSGYMTGKK